MENQNVEIIRRGRPRKEVEDTYKSVWDEERRIKYNKEYYQKNKDKHQLCREEVTCECGRMVLKSTLPYHLKSKCHASSMALKNI
jgi:hypothetical protein